MSIIKDYHEYFIDTSPAIEFAQTIKEAIVFLLEKDSKRYALSRTEKTPPLDYSDMPGFEFGFRPMELCITELKSDSKKKTSGSEKTSVSDSTYLQYTEWLSGRTEKLSPSSSYDLPVPLDAECYALYRAGLHYIGKPSGNIPLLYNKFFGEVYYYPMYINLGKAGRIRIQQDCRGFGVITAVNWISGQTTVIGHQMLAPFTRWCIPELINPDDGRTDWFRHFKRSSFRIRNELMAKPIEEVKKLPASFSSSSPEGLPPDFVSAPGEKFNTGPLALYGFLELIYDLPHVALNDITTEVSIVKTYPMEQYLKLLKLLGNLFQSTLQTWKSRWFLLSLLKSIKSSGKPIDSTITSIPQWLGINRPTWKRFLAMSTPEPFIFFMLMNQYQPTSYEAFEKTYANVRALAPHTCAFKSGLRSTTKCKAITETVVKGKHGRILFMSDQMPLGMGFYSKFDLKKHISIHKYFKWMRQEMNLAILQKKATHEDAIDVIESALRDYNRMAAEVLPSVGYAFPHNLLKAHDVMVENYNRIMLERRSKGTDAEEFMAFAQCYAKKRCDIYADAQFVVRAPATSLDLYEEGVTLNHCVGAYGDDIMAARGSMLIFFLRSAKRPDDPLVTIQVNKSAGGTEYHFTEIAGKGNRLPTETESAFCDKWLVAFNAAYKAAVAASKQDTLDYDKEVLTWLSTLGIAQELLPLFKVTESKEANYERLFTSAMELLAARATEGDDTIDSELLRHSLAMFCGKLNLPKLLYHSVISLFEEKIA